MARTTTYLGAGAKVKPARPADTIAHRRHDGSVKYASKRSREYDGKKAYDRRGRVKMIAEAGWDTIYAGTDAQILAEIIAEEDERAIRRDSRDQRELMKAKAQRARTRGIFGDPRRKVTDTPVTTRKPAKPRIVLPKHLQDPDCNPRKH